MGAVSLIVWTLTLIVSVKYIVIVLRADDEGEGGTFALYTLLTRYVSLQWAVLCQFSWLTEPLQSNIVEHDPKSARTLKMERHLSNHLRRPNRGFRSYLEKSSVAAWSLKILSILGVCLIMAGMHDGHSEVFIEQRLIMSCRRRTDTSSVSPGCHTR